MNYWVPMLIANLWIMLALTLETVPQSFIALTLAVAWLINAWFGGKNA